MRPHRPVFVGVPTRGEIDYEILGAIEKLTVELGTSHPVIQRGHLSAGQTRNLLVRRFLDSDAQVLLFIDDDVVPSRHVPRMIEALAGPEEMPGYDVIGAAVPIFKPDAWPKPVFNAFRSGSRGYVLAESFGAELGLVAAVGAGCLAIARRVLERLRDQEFGFGDAPFAEEMRDGEIVSDDFVFCERAARLGFRIGCDFRARCDHITRVSLGAVLAGLNS